MLPPGSLNCVGDESEVECRIDRSLWLGNCLRQICSRAASSGNGKSMLSCRRRRKASSMFFWKFVARQHDPVVLLEALQQIVDFGIGVAVVRILDLGALAEDGVAFVEEQDALAALGLGEDGAELLLGLADILADHGREIDLEQFQGQRVSQHFGGHGLAGAGRSAEQHRDAASARQFLAKAPVAMDHLAVSRPAPPPSATGCFGQSGRTRSSQS